VASTGLVVTNYHVIDEAGTTDSLRIEVKGKARKVRGLHGFLPKHDLALLAMETKRGEALPFLMLAQGLPDQGEKAYAVGYPLGLPNATITDGLINGFQKLHGIRFIQTSAPISEGSSGGPLLLPDATVAGDDHVDRPVDPLLDRREPHHPGHLGGLQGPPGPCGRRAER